MINTKGLMLATAAAALFASGVSLAEQHQAAGTEAKVHCSGVNACKGKSECKTATDSCAGKNSCAGQGWVSMTKADCEAKGGKVAE
ncbi:MAG: BufA2 family periplasmic bufferin-type metallophore [Gammaproteobacteria bacterium]